MGEATHHMAANTSGTKTRRCTASESEVDGFLATLEHARKPEILALRQIILDADPRIGEGIKWNAPSFRLQEYFATFHLRARDGIQIILHFGAKQRESALSTDAVSDPTRMLKWLGRDRATVVFENMADVTSRSRAFAQLIRDWLAHA